VVTKDFGIPKVEPILIYIKGREGKLTASFSTSSIRKVFSFPFADPHWKSKLLIGMGILFASFIIPILPGLVIYGYFYQIMQRVIVKSEEPTLPEWQDWGKLLGDGFRLFGVSFIYSLPMSVLYFAGILVYGVMIFSIPWIENTGVEGGKAALIMIGIMSFFFLIVLLAMIFAFVLSVILPLAWCQTIAAGSFKGGFEIGKYWQVFRSNFSGFLIATTLMYGLFTILMMVYYVLYMSLVLWCLIPFLLIIGGMLTGLFSFVLWASVYREGMDKLEEQAG
jgi:hypothetical protein